MMDERITQKIDQRGAGDRNVLEEVEELRRYIVHCTAVSRDITHVLEDYEFQKDDNKIEYAVDFSEIFSYALPDKTTERSPMADGWGEDSKLQFFVLSRFFERKNIILPEP